VVQFDREASQTRDYCVEKERDATRGSPRFLTAQRALVRNDNQTAPPPAVLGLLTTFAEGCVSN